MKRFVSLISASCAIVAGCAFLLAGGAAGASSATSSSALPTVSIAMDGKSIVVSGTLQSGAVNVVSTVTKVAFAEPVLVRLNPGVTLAQVQAQVTSHRGDLNSLDGYATIVFDADASRGTSQAQTVLQPGMYGALDLGTNKKPHPRTTFTVTQASSPAALPAANATISAIEFGFVGPSVLHNGWIVRAHNEGWLVHMTDALGVRSAADGLKVIALLRQGKDRQAMRLTTNAFFSLAEPVSHDAVQQSVLNTQPGWYVQACFMNTQDGREHTQLGMERLIRVVK